MSKQNQQLLDAKKTLRNLDGAKNNTDYSDALWEKTVEYRKIRLKEYIAQLETV